MIHVEKVAVSLPKKLTDRIEKVRHQLGYNRSQFFRMAIKFFLETFPEKEDQNLARIYKEIRRTDQELLRRFAPKSYKHLPPYEK